MNYYSKGPTFTNRQKVSNIPSGSSIFIWAIYYKSFTWIFRPFPKHLGVTGSPLRSLSIGIRFMIWFFPESPRVLVKHVLVHCHGFTASVESEGHEQIQGPAWWRPQCPEGVPVSCRGIPRIWSKVKLAKVEKVSAPKRQLIDLHDWYSRRVMLMGQDPVPVNNLQHLKQTSDYVWSIWICHCVWIFCASELRLRKM